LDGRAVRRAESSAPVRAPAIPLRPDVPAPGVIVAGHARQRVETIRLAEKQTRRRHRDLPTRDGFAGGLCERARVVDGGREVRLDVLIVGARADGEVAELVRDRRVDVDCLDLRLDALIATDPVAVVLGREAEWRVDADAKGPLRVDRQHDIEIRIDPEVAGVATGSAERLAQPGAGA